jgi:DNA-directed RNA polymerase I subunit RPA49
MLYYLSSLIALNDSSSALSKLKPSELSSKFPGLPQQVLNGLLSRFAEQQSSKKAHAITEKGKVKLLAWICVVFLHCEGWSIEIGKVAKDLSMTPNV